MAHPCPVLARECQQWLEPKSGWVCDLRLAPAGVVWHFISGEEIVLGIVKLVCP